MYKTKKIDASKYINAETGEIMDSEIANISNINVLDKDRIMITSTDFASIDSNAYRYAESVLSYKEMYYLNSMIHEIDTDFNLVYNSVLRKPCNITDLANKFKTQRNTMARSFKRMQNLKILTITKIENNQAIMINPTLARKQKVLKASTMKLFTDLSIIDAVKKD